MRGYQSILLLILLSALYSVRSKKREDFIKIQIDIHRRSQIIVEQKSKGSRG